MAPEHIFVDELRTFESALSKALSSELHLATRSPQRRILNLIAVATGHSVRVNFFQESEPQAEEIEACAIDVWLEGM